MNKKNLPLISIALCTYNGERYLKEQVDSLLNQTYPNIEIIISDDCSTDGTYSLLQTYYGNNSKICFYQNSHNLGFVNNFLKILNLCKGEYIALCDQDDIWVENKISKLYNNINNNILIYSDSQLINDKGDLLNKKMSEIVYPVSRKNTRALVLRNSVSGHAMMFQKDLIKHITSIPLKYHDWWIAYIASCVGSIAYVNECLVYYRQHGKSVTDILGKRGHVKKIKTKTIHTKDRVKESLQLINWINIFLSCEQNSKSDRIFLEKLIKGYEDRMERSFFSFKLFSVLITNLSLYKIGNKSKISLLFYAFKEGFGLRTKKNFHTAKHSLFYK